MEPQTFAITKRPKVALCRKCRGMGVIQKDYRVSVCPQCQGSGRVMVSATMAVTVEPFTSPQASSDADESTDL